MRNSYGYVSSFTMYRTLQLICPFHLFMAELGWGWLCTRTSFYDTGNHSRIHENTRNNNTEVETDSLSLYLSVNFSAQLQFHNKFLME